MREMMMRLNARVSKMEDENEELKEQFSKLEDENKTLKAKKELTDNFQNKKVMLKEISKVSGVVKSMSFKL